MRPPPIYPLRPTLTSSSHFFPSLSLSPSLHPSLSLSLHHPQSARSAPPGRGRKNNSSPRANRGNTRRAASVRSYGPESEFGEEFDDDSWDMRSYVSGDSRTTSRTKETRQTARSRRSTGSRESISSIKSDMTTVSVLQSRRAAIQEKLAALDRTLAMSRKSRVAQASRPFANFCETYRAPITTKRPGI